MISKERFQKLAGLPINEATIHMSEHDHIAKIAERHAVEIIKEMDLPPEDREIALDDLSNMLREYLQNFSATLLKYKPEI